MVEMLFSSSLIAVVGAGEQVKISSPSPPPPCHFLLHGKSAQCFSFPLKLCSWVPAILLSFSSSFSYSLCG